MLGVLGTEIGCPVTKVYFMNHATARGQKFPSLVHTTKPDRLKAALRSWKCQLPSREILTAAQAASSEKMCPKETLLHLHSRK